ncbi:MAG TPA: 3-methyl-2-oxobutanoate hydroxymethyltransferase [Candidatus Omnitrophota bacterium]|nr:3-methyl-2-oxobutanoate hydroxymethyltransferase [Candidatus Omnitrophota bacterium]
MSGRKTKEDILQKKKKGEKIVMLTAYDYPLASLIDRSGADIVLVGDSLANVVLGLERTKDVGMAEMIHHAKAVNRAVKQAMLVGDMPYEAYQENIETSVVHARRFIEEAGCQAVKLEWFDQCLKVVRKIIQAGIPVMGHVGLTPQTADRLGGLKVQGKDAQSARQIMANAQALEEAGCFCVVLECIPMELASMITQTLSIPTIGIGAGVHCDGQVLVTHDLLGYVDLFQPKFTKKYAHLDEVILTALKEYCHEVKTKRFPDEAHSYHIDKEQLTTVKAKSL